MAPRSLPRADRRFLPAIRCDLDLLVRLFVRSATTACRWWQHRKPSVRLLHRASPQSQNWRSGPQSVLRVASRLDRRDGSTKLQFFSDFGVICHSFRCARICRWVMLNLGMAMKQFEETQQVSGSMVCVNCFQMLYVWDALYNEQAILTTMDITTDGFGFMLAFGDLSWVPFTYSLQARILVYNDPELSVWALLTVICINTLGFFIFRGEISPAWQTLGLPCTSSPHPSSRNV
mmetsp:Transcript_6174/g.13644  ORF Transcript_6174/g.13644 Transcript_6174/m.13644 type:complete len:233 (+) Transcript_6174:514-1212(+)